VDSVSGGGTNAVEVRSELGANSSRCEVSLHQAEFALGTVFPPIKLNSLVFYCLEFALMRPISINISNNTGILEIDDGIVDEKSGSGGRMKNVEVVIFDPRAVEVGSGMCLCMKGNGILGVATLASSYKMSVDLNLPKGNITCHLILSVLVEENKWVLSHITAIVLAPSGSWMVWVVKLLSELGYIGNGTRCG